VEKKAEVGNSGAFFFVSFAFGELAGLNFLKYNYFSILLGSFGRAKEPTEGSSAKPNEKTS
jgi:hypothetical protein